MNERKFNETLLRVAIQLFFKVPPLRKPMITLYRATLPKRKFPKYGEAPEIKWSKEFIPNSDQENKILKKNTKEIPLKNSIKIVAMYKVRNESRWIEHSLRSISDICKEIVIFDNGSTDNTVNICEKFPNVVEIYKKPPSDFDDHVAEKNILLKMGRKRKPDYLLQIDGDEVLQPFAKNILLKELQEVYPQEHMFQFQYIHSWDKPNQYRYDGIFGDFWNSKLFKMEGQPKDLRFIDSPFGIHFPTLPMNVKGWHNPIKSQVKILHYNVYDENIRKKRYEYYSKEDPNNKTYGEYKHLLGAYGPFSGPDGVELRTIPDGFYIKDV